MNNVLIVDDDLQVLEAVEALLTTKGLKVKTETRCENTFLNIESFDPDIILMDIGLGIEDGRTITKQIKTSDATGHIPVILISGIKGISSKLENCFNDDFISKPFDSTILLDKIERHLKRQHQENKNDYNWFTEVNANKKFETLSLFYDRYAASIYGYILSIVGKKRESERILMIVFNEIFHNSNFLKSDNDSVKTILLKCIRLTHTTILKITGKERKSFLSGLKKYRQIQNN